MQTITRKRGIDGSHRGLGDWYPDYEEQIVQALAQGPQAEWTTDWYASKHEIASAKITCASGKIKIEASVTDDFDTPGYGVTSIDFTDHLEVIREAIYTAWDAASDNRKENEQYVGFSIHDPKGSWIETYLRAKPDDMFGICHDAPPGDNYHEWGFQDGNDEIPEAVKERLEEWADDWTPNDEQQQFTVGNFTIKPWKDE